MARRPSDLPELIRDAVLCANAGWPFASSVDKLHRVETPLGSSLAFRVRMADGRLFTVVIAEVPRAIVESDPSVPPLPGSAVN